jgi:hypothetical protein
VNPEQWLRWVGRQNLEEVMEESSTMIMKTPRSKLLTKIGQNALAVLCSFLLLQTGSPLAAQTQQKPDSPVSKGSVNTPLEQQEATVKIVVRQIVVLCFARIKTAFEMNNIQRRDVTL